MVFSISLFLMLVLGHADQFYAQYTNFIKVKTNSSFPELYSKLLLLDVSAEFKAYFNVPFANIHSHAHLSAGAASV